MIKIVILSLVSTIEQVSSVVCIQCHVLQYPDPSPFHSAYIAPGSHTSSTVEWEGSGYETIMLTIPMLATKINDVVLFREWCYCYGVCSV